MTERFEVALRKNAVSAALNKMGKFILLYCGEFSRNDTDLMPANVRGDSNLRGNLFVAFLALILRMKQMRFDDRGLLPSQKEAKTKSLWQFWR